MSVALRADDCCCFALPPAPVALGTIGAVASCLPPATAIVYIGCCRL